MVYYVLLLMLVPMWLVYSVCCHVSYNMQGSHCGGAAVHSSGELCGCVCECVCVLVSLHGCDSCDWCPTPSPE